MGLFDLFKKKQPQTASVTQATNKKQPQAVSVTVTMNEKPHYDPWKNTNQPRNDNYAIAAFVSMSEKGASVGKSNDNYPRYFSYTYKVFDPVKYHKKVIEDGYLTEAPPEYSLKKMKVDQLKAILADAGLSDKGKKDILISRIVESVPLSPLNLETYYLPSEKGLEHLKKFDYVFSLSNYDISWEAYDDFAKNRPDYLKPNDIIWQLLNERFNANNIKGYYGSAGHDLGRMGKFLEREERFLDALSHYTKALYYATSGCESPHLVYKPEEIYISPHLIEPINRLGEHYDSRIIDRCYDRYRLQQHYISKENFEKLLFDIFADNPISIQNYMK